MSAGGFLVDSHCHLNFPDYHTDLDEVIKRAHDSGVRIMQTICTEMAEFDEVLAIANKYEGVYCSVGVHPNDSGKQEIPTVDELVSKTHHPRVIGIGETGLDFHYENSPREAQIESFRRHIAAGRITGLPVIVHSRAADEETIAILQEEMGKGAFKALIHCFSTTKYLSDNTIDLGFYISIAGIATFKKASELRDIIKEIPIGRLLVETDAPYLAPEPYRGKRNEPSYVKYTNKLISELKQISEEECAKHTTDNFFSLFTKVNRPV